MTDEEAFKKLAIGIAVKLVMVVGIGTAVAFWYMSTI